MEIKTKLVIFVFLVTSLATKANVSCREHFDIKVYNNNLEHEYRYDDDGKPILIKKEKVKRPFSRHWSNVAASLHEIFYEYSSKEFIVDNVDIKYVNKEKVIYNKNYKVTELSSGSLKIKNFVFNDGVVDKKFRPGRQVYTFKYGQKAICEIEVMHFFATEF